MSERNHQSKDEMQHTCRAAPVRSERVHRGAGGRPLGSQGHRIPAGTALAAGCPRGTRTRSRKTQLLLQERPTLLPLPSARTVSSRSRLLLTPPECLCVVCMPNLFRISPIIIVPLRAARARNKAYKQKADQQIPGHCIADSRSDAACTA